MNLGDLDKVWEIKVLKKPGEEEAMKILERIAKQVQPIMRKHKWRVKILSEFCPRNPALMGLNVGGGAHVKLRLRTPNRDWDFYPFDQVLDTMLHELCHNVHGPHNASFYQLWDELRKECEDLMLKGINGTGKGFDLLGKRLGGFSHQPPLSSLRQTALAAAEKRAKFGALLPSGPKRLGGDSSIRVALSPIQAAAMAAERRLQDNIWCGSEAPEESGDAKTATDFSDKPSSVGAEDQMIHNDSYTRASDVASGKRENKSSNSSVSNKLFNDCLDSSDVELVAVNSQNVHQILSETTSHRGAHDKSSKLQSAIASTSRSTPSQEMRCDDEESAMWQCLTCTLLNPQLAPICELCSAERPKDVKEKYKIWSCKFCTLENSVKLEKCAACDRWRYSHGHPVATLVPNFHA